MLRKLLKIIGLLLLLFLLYVGGVLLHGTLNDWQPEGETEVASVQEAPESVVTDSVISLAIWNVGYTGLGEESDFFYDSGGFFLSGGKMIRADEDLVAKNRAGSRLFTTSTDADFFLFQEVDLESRRSYYVNLMDTLRTERPDYTASYAANYRVKRVPIPILEPWRAYGKVESGLVSLSRWQPKEESRIQLPGKFDWPTRIFQLDRCLLLSRIATAAGPDLVVINAHLSAYDKGGVLKKQQMEFIQKLILEEYEKGNYVIVGADWNQCPPYFQFDSFMPGRSDGYSQTNIPDDFVPEGWQWVYDPVTPTNRKLRSPFDAEKSFQTIIDFFLLSPNLKALRVKTIDQQFRFSDHQPVWLEVELQ
ncbi:MAG: endonuclease/exonuclease/phosphatase family protein [Bacteroidota bacterium]